MLQWKKGRRFSKRINALLPINLKRKKLYIINNKKLKGIIKKKKGTSRTNDKLYGSYKKDIINFIKWKKIIDDIKWITLISNIGNDIYCTIPQKIVKTEKDLYRLHVAEQKRLKRLLLVNIERMSISSKKNILQNST